MINPKNAIQGAGKRQNQVFARIVLYDNNAEKDFCA